MRLTLGIGRPERKGKVIGHVLGAPSRRKRSCSSAAVERGAEAVLLLEADGPETVMNEVNRKEPPS